MQDTYQILVSMALFFLIFFNTVLRWEFHRGELRQFYFISYVSMFLKKYKIQGGPHSMEHLRSAIPKTSSTDVIDFFSQKFLSE